MDSRPPHKQRRRRRRLQREDRDYFEFATDEAPDAKDQRSVGIMFMVVVGLLLLICALMVLRSMDVERFPGM